MGRKDRSTRHYQRSSACIGGFFFLPSDTGGAGQAMVVESRCGLSNDK
jgi:hypothetical protein